MGEISRVKNWKREEQRCCDEEINNVSGHMSGLRVGEGEKKINRVRVRTEGNQHKTMWNSTVKNKEDSQ